MALKTRFRCVVQVLSVIFYDPNKYVDQIISLKVLESTIEYVDIPEDYQ